MSARIAIGTLFFLLSGCGTATEIVGNTYRGLLVTWDVRHTVLDPAHSVDIHSIMERGHRVTELPADERFLLAAYLFRYQMVGLNARSQNPATLPCTIGEAIDRQRDAMMVANR